MANPLGGGLSSAAHPRNIGKAILIIAGIIAVLLGLLLASRAFGFTVINIPINDNIIIMLLGPAAVITGSYTIIKAIKSSKLGGI